MPVHIEMDETTGTSMKIPSLWWIALVASTQKQHLFCLGCTFGLVRRIKKAFFTASACQWQQRRLEKERKSCNRTETCTDWNSFLSYSSTQSWMEYVKPAVLWFIMCEKCSLKRSVKMKIQLKCGFPGSAVRGCSLSHQQRNCLDWRNGRTLERRANQLRERQRRVEEWRGWRNAFMTNGCLETVVKETMSPRVLWHLNCSWIFIQILGRRLFIFLPGRLMRGWFVTGRKGKLFKVRLLFFFR